MDAILVAHDGTELADQAIRFAAELARSTAARVVLLHARPPAAGALAEGSEEWPSAPTADALARAEARLAAAGGRVERRCPRGRPAAAIVEAAADEPVDLIVMATHARGEVGRLLHGSVANEVVGRSPVPVVLVPPETGPAEARGRAEVLVPLDGSQVAEAALDPAGRLADALGAGLLLLAAVEASPQGSYYVGPERELAAERAYLDLVAARLRDGRRPVRTEARVGHPPAVIAAAARAPGVRAVAMATHGRTGLARLLLGSTAAATIQQARVPVLVVPTAAAARGPARPERRLAAAG